MPPLGPLGPLVVHVGEDQSGFTFALPPSVRGRFPGGRSRVFVAKDRPGEPLAAAMTEVQLRVVAAVLVGDPSEDGLPAPVRFVRPGDSSVLVRLPARPL